MGPISVIIPTWNRVDYLQRAMLSVKKQTLSCGELIIVDDGSTDDTRRCVSTFAGECDFSVIYLHQENKGPAAARNRGVLSSSYPFIAFLDSDDHWKKNKLALQYGALKEQSQLLISHTCEQWLRRGKHLNQKKIHQPRSGDIFDHSLQLCAVGMSTVMVRKEFFDSIGLFNEDLRCCEDYDLWLRAGSRMEFLLVETPLTIKEGGREDQVSHQYRVGMDKFRIFSILSILQNDMLSGEKRISAFQELEKKSRVYGQGCVKHGRAEEGGLYLETALWAKKISSGDFTADSADERSRFFLASRNAILENKNR